jgi:hypothetical protein
MSGAPLWGKYVKTQGHYSVLPVFDCLRDLRISAASGDLSYNGRSMNAPSTITASLRDSVRRELASIVGGDWVLNTQDELIVYECDGLTLHPRLPDFVVLPAPRMSSRFAAAAQRHKMPFFRVVPDCLSGGNRREGASSWIFRMKCIRVLTKHGDSRMGVRTPI